MPEKLTELEALERAQALLLPRGYRFSGSVEGMTMQRGRFMSAYWALSPNMWPARLTIATEAEVTRITLEITPPNAPTPAEVGYWESEADSVATLLAGGQPAETGTEATRRMLIQNAGITLGVAVAVGIVARVAGLLAGAVTAIVLIAGLYQLLRGKRS